MISVKIPRHINCHPLDLNRTAQLTLASNKEWQSLQSSKQMETTCWGKRAFNLVKKRKRKIRWTDMRNGFGVLVIKQPSDTLSLHTWRWSQIPLGKRPFHNNKPLWQTARLSQIYSNAGNIVTLWHLYLVYIWFSPLAEKYDRLAFWDKILAESRE